MKFKTLIALLAVSPMVSSIQAQETTIQPQNQSPRTQTTDVPTLPGMLASKMLLGNHCMIKSATMASEKANNSEVREFAEMLVKEHTECCDSLKSIAPASFTNELKAMDQKYSKQSDSSADRTAQNPLERNASDAQRNQQTLTADRTRIAGSDTSLLRQLGEIEKSAAFKKSESLQKMMKECSKEDFDMAFVGTQIVAHIDMLACLEAIQEANVPELQQVSEKAVSMTKKHLEKAKSLAKNLEKDSRDDNDDDNDRN